MPSSLLSFVLVATKSPSPSEEISQRPQTQVEIAVPKADLRLQFFHALREPHEREPETLDLLVVECPLLHPAKRLPLHELTQELHERQHELRQPPLDLLRVGVDAPRERIPDLLQLPRDRLHVPVRGEQALDAVGGQCQAAAPPKLYGAQGPVHTTVSSGWAAAKPRTGSCAASGHSRSTRYDASKPPRSVRTEARDWVSSRSCRPCVIASLSASSASRDFM